MSEHHDDHDHEHEAESYASMRTKALESLLVEKGYVTTDAIDALVKTYEEDIGPMNGARVVAPGVGRRGIQSALAAGRDQGYRRIGVSGSGKVRRLWFWRTRRMYTTPLFARCARATRGPCSASRRRGTSPSRTGLAWSSSREKCLKNSD